MLWNRIIWLFLLLLFGKHVGFPSSPRYLELADSADFYIARDNWTRAEDKIIEALRLEPANFTNSMLLANLGLVQTNLGKYNKAINSLSLGLNLAPSSTVLLNNRAHVYLLVDSIDAAIRDLDRSIAIDSLQEWTLQTRAFLYLKNEKIPEAKDIFNKLKKNFPDNSAVYSGFAAIAEYEGDFHAAKTNYNKAILLNPNDEETREAYIFLLIKSDEYTLARSQIREALNINPENPMYYLLRGYLHRLNYRMEEALADKKIAISKGIDSNYASSFIP